MNELQSLDIVERLRAWVIQRRPATEADLRECSAPLGSLPAMERKLKSLAGYLDTDDQTAAGRRSLRRLIQEMERDEWRGDDCAGGLSPGSGATAGVADWEADELAESVREDEPERSDEPNLTPARVAQIRRLWDWVDTNALVAAGASGESMLRDLRETLPFLKGLSPYRVLHRLGFDVPIPDQARQRVLFRLGFVSSSPGASESHRFDAFAAMTALARMSGESVRGTGLLLGLFSGGTGADGFGPCRARPLCGRCPLRELCLFHRFGHDGRGSGRGAGRIKDWAEEDRPRERVARHGVEPLTDAELLAVILRTGTGKQSAVDLARELLGRFESLERLDQASLSELESHRGIGSAKAAEIKAALELGKRVLRSPLATGRRLLSSHEVFQAMKSQLAGQQREQFLLVALNTKNEILRVITVSIGSLSQSLVHPREVFREAIRESAATVMLVHNHPSGDPYPSRDDEQITQRLARAGDLLGIRVVDHIIIGRDRYFSFADEGRLGIPQ